jgi:hypothetical protein
MCVAACKDERSDTGNFCLEAGTVNCSSECELSLIKVAHRSQELWTPEADEETGHEDIYPIVVEVQFMCLDQLRVALSVSTLLEDVLSRIDFVNIRCHYGHY